MRTLLVLAVFALGSLAGAQNAMANITPVVQKSALYLVHGLNQSHTSWPGNFMSLLDAKVNAMGDSYRVFALSYKQKKNAIIGPKLELYERIAGQWVLSHSHNVSTSASRNVTRLGNLIKVSMESDLDSSYNVRILGVSFGGYIARDYIVEQMNGVSYLQNMTSSVTFVDHPHLGNAEYLKTYVSDGLVADIDIDLAEAIQWACGTKAVNDPLVPDCANVPDGRCGSEMELKCAAVKRLNLWNQWKNTIDNGRYPWIEWTNFYGAGPLENPPENVTTKDTYVFGIFTGVVTTTFDLPPGRTDTPGKTRASEDYRSCSTSGGHARLRAEDANCAGETSDFSSRHRYKNFDNNFELPFLAGEDGHGGGSTLRKKRVLRQLGLFNTRLIGDVTGDGAKDIVEFDDLGVRVHVALPPGQLNEQAEVPGFMPPEYWTDQFSYQNGWRHEQHPRYLADVNHDGKMDIIGFGEKPDGIWVALSNGDPDHVDGGFSSALVLCSGGNCWSAANGYKGDQHPRLALHLSENSDRVFITYFSNAGLRMGELIHDQDTGDLSYEYRASVDVMGFSDGWRAEEHPRMLADVNGDGWMDVIGFGNAAVRVVTTIPGESSLALATSNWKNDNFTANIGWKTHKNPRLFGDVDGDGDDDLVGFANGSTFVSLSTGTSFGAHSVWAAGLGFNDGWRVDNVNSRTRKRSDRFVRDADGDGYADVVGYDKTNKLRFFRSNGTSAFTEVADPKAYPQLWDVMQGRTAPLNYERFLVDVHGDGFVRLVTIGIPDAYMADAKANYLLIDRNADGIPDAIDTPRVNGGGGGAITLMVLAPLIYLLRRRRCNTHL